MRHLSICRVLCFFRLHAWRSADPDSLAQSFHQVILILCQKLAAEGTQSEARSELAFLVKSLQDCKCPLKAQVLAQQVQKSRQPKQHQ